jgi:hypothetical protein
MKIETNTDKDRCSVVIFGKRTVLATYLPEQSREADSRNTYTQQRMYVEYVTFVGNKYYPG